MINLHCSNSSYTKYRQEKLITGLFVHNTLPPLITPPDDTFFDNGDGTISVYNYTSYKLVIIKKCLQGQAFRTEQNDCQGNGDSSNNYGASLLSFCNTDDNSCNDTEIFNLTSTSNSEIYLSCNNDTFNKKSWKVISSTYILDIINESEFLSFYTEFPKNGHYWTSNAYSFDSSKAYYVSYIFGLEKGKKTKEKYLLCMENE
ncbi:MAG: hypothetical protein H7A25_04180 [Leptospiraceae bacterium]|nr:hypothetical protein [Leptospiraceae bacterium]